MSRRSFSLGLASIVLASLAVATALPADAAQPRFPKCSCVTGALARKADGQDWVCVSRASRATVLRENAAAAENRISATDNGCKPGFVWRDAFDGDGVCVVPAARARVHNENAHWNDLADPYAAGPCNTLH